MGKYYLALFAAVFIWGSYFVPLKFALSTLPPTVVAFLAALSASLVFWITSGKKVVQSIRDRFHFSLIGVGLFGTFGFNLLMNYGLKQTQVIHASLIITLLPILGILSGFLFYREKIGFPKITGCLFSIVGVIYLLGRGSWEVIASFTFHRGDLLVLAAVFSLIFHILIAKKARQFYNSRTVTTLQLSLGTLLFFPLALKDGLLDILSQITPLIWLSILYVGMVRSVFANLFYNYSIQKIDVSIATLATNAEFLVAAFFSILLLGEKLTFVPMIAAVLIIFGVTLSIQSKLFFPVVKSQNIG